MLWIVFVYVLNAWINWPLIHWFCELYLHQEVDYLFRPRSSSWKLHSLSNMVVTLILRELMHFIKVYPDSHKDIKLT